MAEAHPEPAAKPLGDTHSTIETHAPAAEHHEAPSVYGVTAPMFIGLAMLFVFGLMIWKKVPAAIAKALDSKIAGIREQLAEAEALRKEAEALKSEYEAKAAAAEASRSRIRSRNSAVAARVKVTTRMRAGGCAGWQPRPLYGVSLGRGYSRNVNQGANSAPDQVTC